MQLAPAKKTITRSTYATQPSGMYVRAGSVSRSAYIRSVECCMRRRKRQMHDVLSYDITLFIVDDELIRDVRRCKSLHGERSGRLRVWYDEDEVHDAGRKSAKNLPQPLYLD